MIRKRKLANLTKKAALEWNFKKPILEAFLGLLIMILLWKGCPDPPHKIFSVLEVDVSFTTTSELTVHSNQICRKEFQMGGSGHA